MTVGTQEELGIGSALAPLESDDDADEIARVVETAVAAAREARQTLGEPQTKTDAKLRQCIDAADGVVATVAQSVSTAKGSTDAVFGVADAARVAVQLLLPLSPIRG